MSKIYSKVAGSTHAKHSQATIPKLKNGDLLMLKRESQNSYDKNAIVISYGDTKLGYVEAGAARSLAPRMDEGETFTCIVEQVTGGGEGYNYGLNYSLESNEDNYAPENDDTVDSIDDLLGI